MDIKDLKEYLSICIDMEKHIYAQNEAMYQLEYKMAKLGSPGYFYSKPTKPASPFKFSYVFSILIKYGIGLAIAFFIVLVLFAIFHKNDMLFNIAFVLWLIAVIVIFVIIPIAILISEFSSYRFKKEHYKSQLQDYNDYFNGIRICPNEKRWNFYKSNLKNLEEINSISKSNLEEIYDYNIIYPKYRNFTMLCSIYEYICAGRCTTLGEAYNILEQELQFNRINLQLDKIIDTLEEIRENQYMLFSAIKESTELTKQMLDVATSINDASSAIADNSASVAYNTQRTEKELYYMTRMNYLSGKYDNVFFNELPYLGIAKHNKI